MKTDYKQFEKSAKKLIDYYKRQMCFENYQIFLEYDNKLAARYPMGISINFPYLSAVIHYNDVAVVREKEKLLDYLIRHEMNHIPFSRLIHVIEKKNHTKSEIKEAFEWGVDTVTQFKIWEGK